mmetsp:Transcript_20369/g.60740  ORF Transcript_20369/g.60740 Transcript_20369/m.60740 type:complete len:363 (-) Transcript_20369:43-1131(-)
MALARAAVVLVGLTVRSAAAPESSKEVRIFVDRAHGHSGSRWFASMLGASNFSTFFQFGGLCAESKTEELGAARRAEMLQSLLSRGCACGGGVLETKMPARCKRVTDGQILSADMNIAVRGCNWNQWCDNQCAGRESRGCRGVAVLTGHMHQPKASDAAVFMWLRYNSVKSAYSRLKHPCQAPGLSHYDKGAKVSRAVVKFADPMMLLKRSASTARERAAGEERVDKASRLYYEDFQRDPKGALAAVFEVLGVHASVAAAATQKYASSVKLTPERLADAVLDFDAVNRTFVAHPCLHAQLLAEWPRPFDLCPDEHVVLEHKARYPSANNHKCSKHQKDGSAACEAARDQLGEDADVCELVYQ